MRKTLDEIFTRTPEGEKDVTVGCDCGECSVWHKKAKADLLSWHREECRRILADLRLHRTVPEDWKQGVMFTIALEDEEINQAIDKLRASLEVEDD